MDYTTVPDKFIGANSIQVQPYGLGFYLLDNRKNKIGWTMVMNMAFGVGMNLDISEEYMEWYKELYGSYFGSGYKVVSSMLYFPLDVSLVGRYHLNEHSAVQVGLNISNQFGEHNRLLLGAVVGFTF